MEYSSSLAMETALNWNIEYRLYKWSISVRVVVMTVVCRPFQVQYLTLMGMELHARSRRDLEPDPEFDPICALFYCLSSDGPLPNVDGTQLTGAIVVDKDHQSCDRGE